MKKMSQNLTQIRIRLKQSRMYLTNQSTKTISRLMSLDLIVQSRLSKSMVALNKKLFNWTTFRIHISMKLKIA